MAHSEIALRVQQLGAEGVRARLREINQELNDMLTSALRHCFSLSLAEIDDMEMNECIQIFLKLSKAASKS